MMALKLIVCSFFASLGFGIVFQVRGRNLFWAGLGGAVTRCVFLAFMAMFEQRLVFVTLAAAVAALYAEVLANCKRMPSTVFLYPTIIPLIPADLLYNAVLGFLLGDWAALRENAWNCMLALAGMSVGFVVVSTVVYYIRKYRRQAGQELKRMAVTAQKLYEAQNGRLETLDSKPPANTGTE